MNENTDKIEWLLGNIELLKQDKLKNYICISGVPVDLINDDNTADIIIAIAKKFGIELNKSQFSSYTVANKKFIIAQFFNAKHKSSLKSKLRVKRSLMVEEVFNQQHNSQIYINDHLTPHFNHLFLMARRAKKDGALVSATSSGGKVRVRKNANDAPTTITNENQLTALIGMNSGSTTTEPIIVDDVSDDNQTPQPSTSTLNNYNAMRHERRGRSNNNSTGKSTQSHTQPSEKKRKATTPNTELKKAKK